MKSILVVLMFLVSAVVAQGQEAKAIRGFVAISLERELFVDYVPAKRNQPTLVLINGLTYSTQQWKAFVEPLQKKGIGILRYDPVGQGQTLLKYAPITQVIPLASQVEDLKTLLRVLKIPAPYNFGGLSYGGGVAAEFASAYPELVKTLILMAPFTQPLEQTDKWIKSQIWATRNIFPFNKYSDDDLYDHFLQQIVYLTYPQAEPIVLENPFKLEATFRLVQGIRKARPIDNTQNLPEKSVHLLIARQDQYIETKVLDDYWDAVPAGARASRLYMNNSEHKMVEAVPNFTAGWVYEILKGNSKLYEGRDFEGYPSRGEVRSGEDEIKVGRE